MSKKQKGYETCCLWCQHYAICKERPTKRRQCCPCPEQKTQECLNLIRDGYCQVCPTFRQANEVQTSVTDGDVLTVTDLMIGRKGKRPKWRRKAAKEVVA